MLPLNEWSMFVVYDAAGSHADVHDPSSTRELDPGPEPYCMFCLWSVLMPETMQKPMIPTPIVHQRSIGCFHNMDECRCTVEGEGA